MGPFSLASESGEVLALEQLQEFAGREENTGLIPCCIMLAFENMWDEKMTKCKHFSFGGRGLACTETDFLEVNSMFLFLE